MKKRQALTGLCFLLVAFQAAHAQNNNSPYSIIGIGDIEKSFFDRTSGMANTGIALSSNRFIYQANPASYSSLDNLFFNIEVATRYKAVNYSGTPITSGASGDQSSDLQFKKITFAIKLKPRWAISMGLLPFSNSNYSFGSEKFIQGSTLTEPAFYEGSGSTNQFYLANSYKVSRNFSLGLQVAYLFGQMDQTETINSTGLSDSTLVTNRNIILGNFYFTAGFQYHARLSKKWNISVGGTVSPQTNLNADYNLQVMSGSTILVNNLYYQSKFFVLPAIYNGGVAAVLNNKYTFAMDYNYQPWSHLNYSGLNYVLTNSSRVSAGFEYSKKVALRDGSVIEKSYFQSGIFYDNSYLAIAGTQLKNYGMTIGTGFTPFRANGNFAVSTALEIGVRGTTNNNLVRENYTQFNLTLTYRDFWLPVKLRKFD